MSSAITGLLPGFMGWADPWGRLGLWLSLWDDGGQPLVGIAEPHPFWQLLRTSSNRFQSLLRQLALQTLNEEPRCVELEPHSGIYVLCLPFTHRRRSCGAVLGCAVSTEFLDGEVMSRDCSRHQLDRIVCSQLTRDLPAHPLSTLSTYLEILRSQVTAHCEQVHASRDVRNLSSHLAQSYEELNLIYRVSSNLTVLKRPVVHFEEVCRELLAVSVVQSLAAVIEPGEEGDPDLLVVGPASVDRDQVLRLYRQIGRMEPNAGSALMINNVAATPDLAWAGEWLRQVLVFRLKRHDHHYGALLALNHVEGSDFGSEEIQLINAVVERSSAYLENVYLYEDLDKLFMGMLHALVSSIDAKDPYTCGHSQRVAWLSRHIAENMELSEERCRRVYLSGLLHDVGKIGISEAVLRKTGRLTQEEFDEMKRHPEIGARILHGVRQIEDVLPGVLQHHERYDGHGYPFGLAGEDISELGRIIGLADSFDAMTTSRTYRTAHPVQIAVAEVRRWSGTQFDPRLADLLLRDDPARLLRIMSANDRKVLNHHEFMTRGGGEETT